MGDRFWTSPKRIGRLHRVCWVAYKRCWAGGRSPVTSSLSVPVADEHMSMSAYAYRDVNRNEFTQVTAQCLCGRGGWLRLPKHPHDIPPTKGNSK